MQAIKDISKSIFLMMLSIWLFLMLLKTVTNTVYLDKDKWVCQVTRNGVCHGYYKVRE